MVPIRFIKGVDLIGTESKALWSLCLLHLSVCLSLSVCLAATALHTSFRLLHLTNIPSVFPVNGSEFQVYLLGKLKYCMVRSERAAESDGSDGTFTSWSVFDLQIKEKSEYCFWVFWCDFFFFFAQLVMSFIPNLYQSGCQTKSMLGIFGQKSSTCVY